MKWENWFRWRISACCFFPIWAFAVSSFAQGTVTLEELLRIAGERAESLKALEQSRLALEAEIRSRDLPLSARLTSELGLLNDRRQSLSSSFDRRESKFLDITLTQPLATGTALSLTLGQELAEVNSGGEKNISDWEIRLSQSLWRNGFGRETSLRRKSDQAELQARRYQLEFQRQNFFIDLESVYWDLSLALREEKIRLENLERSEALRVWIQDRVRRSAAEPTDLLQVQALLSDRRLQLIATRNRILELRNLLKQLLSGWDATDVTADLKDLEAARFTGNLAIGRVQSDAVPSRLDALSSRFSAQEARVDADRVKNDLSPVLDAYVFYGQNGIDENFNSSLRAVRPERSVTQAGLIFSVELDGSLKEDRRLAARSQAQAQNLIAENLSRNSVLSWAELQRNLANLQTQLEEAKQLAQFQKRKSEEENRRYRLGRTTAFQAISFEVEATEADLRVYRLHADLRKTEARARLYAYEDSSL